MLGHRFRTIAAGALASTLLALAACGGGDDDAAGDTTTTEPTVSSTTAASSTTLDPAQQAEADVRAAYDAYWAMSERLAAAPDPEDPELAELTVGEARNTLVDHLTTLTAQQRAVVFLPTAEHDVSSVNVTSGTEAIVSDCYVDAARVVASATGETIREATYTTRLDVSLVLDDGGWKVSLITQLDNWEGVTACV